VAHGRALRCCVLRACVAVRVKGAVARGIVTDTTSAYKDSQLIVSVRRVTVESRQGNPSKLIVAKL